MAKGDIRFDKIETDINTLQNITAQCRRVEQKHDHDKLIIQNGRIDKVEENFNNYKVEHKEVHQDSKEEQESLSKNLETVTGNLNQGMTYIKDLQRNGRIKVGLQTAIFAGTISTVIAAIIIYFGTTIFNNLTTKTPTEALLMEVVKQLQQNNKEMKQLKYKLNSPTIIEFKEK